MAITSDVKICNLALVGLGANTITSLTENSEEARKCNAIYETTRDDLIEEHTWNFAIKRVELALSETAPVYGFTNAFQIPGDCLRIIDINIDASTYNIEGDKVLTDEGSIKIKYLARIEDPTKFRTSFAHALAARLEAELAYPITNSKTLAEHKYKIYEIKLRKAKAADAQEGTPPEQITDEWLDARESNTFASVNLGDV